MTINENKKELTTDEALSIVGQALSHDSLRLSQKEHLLIIEAFNKITNDLKQKQNDKS